MIKQQGLSDSIIAPGCWWLTPIILATQKEEIRIAGKQFLRPCLKK
jgi:hypothetical protein